MQMIRKGRQQSKEEGSHPALQFYLLAGQGGQNGRLSLRVKTLRQNRLEHNGPPFFLRLLRRIRHPVNL
jgi:hypothetical protein